MLASVDHIVLTTADLERCLDFYTRVLGLAYETYGQGRIALKFGPHKFNVHPPGFTAGIRAQVPTPGSLDLCFLADRPLKVPGIIPKLTATPGAIRTQAPKLGEHTDEVLRGVGYSDADIERLRKSAIL